jgi:hypothetical protein
VLGFSVDQLVYQRSDVEQACANALWQARNL